MTIQERAKQYAISVSPYPQDRGDTYDTATERAYRRGANEQHDIDLHKACVWLKENRNQLANIDTTGFVKLFRQSMKK